MEVNLCNAKAVSDAGISNLAGAKSITSLDLSLCSQLTDASMAIIGEFSLLRCLRLQGLPELTADGLVHLGSLKELEMLDLSMCRGIGGGLRYLVGLDKLRSLCLGWCNSVSEDDMQYVADLRSLETLDLTSTSVTSEGVEALSALGSLSHLSLAQTDACAK